MASQAHDPGLADTAYVQDVREFASACDSLCYLILARLSDALNLEATERLESFHRHTVESTTFLGLLHYPSSDTLLNSGVGHNKHTDIGTLTLLLSRTPGLQVSTSDGWRFVRPRQNHMVINVGDTVRFLSNALLKSCVHRVVPTKQTATQSRYSICYFLRPESGVSVRTSDGRTRTVRQWHDEKYEVFKLSHDEQKAGLVLTGGMDSKREHL